MDILEIKALPLENNIQDYAVSFKVDIQLGDTLYKDVTITVRQSTLKRIVSRYETAHNW